MNSLIFGNEEIIKILKKFENLDLRSIQPAGIDLRVKRVFKVKGNAFLGKEKRKMPEIEKVFEKGKVLLKKNEFVLVETEEKVKMSKKLAGIILPRSSLSRSGIALLTSFVDPGFKGSLTVGMKNLGNGDFEIEIGARFAQLILFEVKGCSKLYRGRYQGGKVI